MSTGHSYQAAIARYMVGLLVGLLPLFPLVLIAIGIDINEISLPFVAAFTILALCAAAACLSTRKTWPAGLGLLTGLLSLLVAVMAYVAVHSTN